MTTARTPIAVFAGPSLPPEARPSDPTIAWLSPAVAGDGYRLLDDPPQVVVLIDGLFDTSPAIRHKELLDLIAAGVFVVGSASMGALRAAELHGFGMIGVGRIFEAYACGRLSADDEVALLHGPGEWGWRPLTTPLVNVRATLLRAVRERVVGPVEARVCLAASRRLFYKERTWIAILEAWAATGPAGAPGLERFRLWLPGGAVDLKRRDALASLDHAAALLGCPAPRFPPPPQTPFSARLREAVRQRPLNVSAAAFRNRVSTSAGRNG